MAKQDIIRIVDTLADGIAALGKDVWEHPQIALKETYASQAVRTYMKDNGFTIMDVTDMPTAFYAEFGSGSPIIGLMGELDALEGLSQKAGVAYKEPLVEGGEGHGCAHNLLAAAPAGAAVALKQMMETEQLSGTIRYYGCPAEEGSGGKVGMAYQGVFDDLDICYTWHPWGKTESEVASCNASMGVEFSFKGVTAHAAMAPHLGRSALDAMEIMNVGANYLREHIIDGVRLHYVPTTNFGPPNVVPADASVWYSIRAEKHHLLREVLERLIKCAEGAAHMTETTMDYVIKCDTYHILNNRILEYQIQDVLEELGGVPFDDDDHALAKDLVQTFEKRNGDICASYGLPAGTELFTGVSPLGDESIVIPGSTDVGDVSHIVPTAQIHMACVPIGTPGHSWQFTSCAGAPMGEKGSVHTAKALAMVAYEALTDGGEIIRKANEEFKAYGVSYKKRMPNDILVEIQKAKGNANA